MGLVAISVTSFVVAFSGALVPGPLFSITVSESARRGFIAGPLIILGHGLLELLIVALLLMGITPFLTAHYAKLTIGIAGGSTLIYMGYRMIRDARTASLANYTGSGGGGMNPVFSGVIGSISNPYWTLWWVTIGLGYLLSSQRLGVTGIAAFFIGHILADLSWYSLLSFTVSRGRRFIGEKGYRVLLYLCGGFLLFFGIWFFKGF